MPQKRDYYEVLEIVKGASRDDIRRAYRKLAKQYHPDVNKDPGAEDKFKEVNEAYAILSDEERREAYDRFGHAGVEGRIPNFDFGGGINDIFEQFFGFGMRTRGGSRAPRRGADLRYDLTLEFKEAVFGIEREIEFSRQERCSVCDGSGSEPGSSPIRCGTCDGSGSVRQVRQTFLGSMVNVTTCPHCRGRGETIANPCHQCSGRGIEQRTVKRLVQVPAGVDDGTRIRLSGEGEPGSNGGPVGDLYVLIHVKSHRYFRRHKNDIILDLSINVAHAALGADITVPTVDGESPLVIPAGTQPGKVLRLRGKGVPRLRQRGRGDQLVVISVEIPKSLSQEQTRLFEQLSKTMGNEVHPQERTFLDRIKDLLGVLTD